MNDNLEHRWPYHPEAHVLRIVGMVITGVLAATAFALAFGWFVMLLWNWLMPVVFGLGAITYWQAFGIVVLAKLIFGAVGGGRGAHDRRWHRDRYARTHGDWGGRERWRYWREFWEQEGREAFDLFVQRRQGQDKPQDPADTQG